jgi:glutathione S-transferase
VPADPAAQRRDQDAGVHHALSAAEDPQLQDGDFSIAESPAIAAYLSDTYGTAESALIPADPRGWATWLEWCFYAATELDATSLYVMRRHGALKHLYGEAPAAVESAAGYFATQLTHAEQALRDGRRFLVGERFTVTRSA